MALSIPGEDSTGEQPGEGPRRTPLPIKQLLILVVLLLAEPLTNSIIRSFNNAPTLEIGNPDQNFLDSDAPEEPKFFSRFLVSMWLWLLECIDACSRNHRCSSLKLQLFTNGGACPTNLAGAQFS